MMIIINERSVCMKCELHLKDTYIHLYILAYILYVVKQLRDMAAIAGVDLHGSDTRS